MGKEEFFIYNGKIYPKGTVVWRKVENKISKYIFVWKNADDRYLLIKDGSFDLPGHVSRASLLPSQFFNSIVKIEEPNSNNTQQVRELEKDFARQQKKNNNTLSFVIILAMVAGIAIFPALSIPIAIYCICNSNKK